MNKVLSKVWLAPTVAKIEIEAPLTARKRLAGQFVILRVTETGERIPITIAGSDPNAAVSPSVVNGSAPRPDLCALSLVTSCATRRTLGKPTHIDKWPWVAWQAVRSGGRPAHRGSHHKAGNDLDVASAPGRKT